MSRYVTLPSPYTDFPLALWSAAFVLDVASRWMGIAFSFAAFLNVAFGCIIALIALITGTLEYNRLSQDADTRRRALLHATFSAGALVAFSLSLFVRARLLDTPSTPPPAFWLATAGVVLAAAAAWVGGQLVFDVRGEVWSGGSSPLARRPREA